MRIAFPSAHCTTGWILSTTFSLAITNIAGDNIAVVPALAASIKTAIYPVIIIAYFIIGAVLAGVSAWIGAVTQTELPSITDICAGKPTRDMIAWAILAICIPASALTGGFFSGRLLAEMLQITPQYGAILGLLFYTYCVINRSKGFVVYVSGIAFLTLPCLLYAVPIPLPLPPTGEATFFSGTSWMLIWALVGYNAGGLRPVLLTETGSLVSHRGYAVVIAVAAKWIEGLVTLVFAYVVVESGVTGIFPLREIMEVQWGVVGSLIVTATYLSLFFTCMVPAMVVNMHQIKSLTGLPCNHALLWAFVLVLSITFLGLEKLLVILSLAGIFASIILGVILWHVKKHQDHQ